MTAGNVSQLFGQVSKSMNVQQATSAKTSSGTFATEKFQDYMKKNTDSVLDVVSSPNQTAQAASGGTTQKYGVSKNVSADEVVETSKVTTESQNVKDTETRETAEGTNQCTATDQEECVTKENKNNVTKPYQEEKKTIEVAGKTVELTVREADTAVEGPMKMQAEFTESGLKLTVTMPELSEELKTALTQLKEQLIQKIREGFQVSEEEVQQVMETLAITMFDLMQNGGLQQMAVQLSGGESLVALVTSEDLMATYQKVSKELSEFMESLPVDVTQSMEEIAGKLAQMTGKLDELLREAGVDTPEQLEAAVKETKAEIGQLVTQAIVETPKTVDVDETVQTMILEETASLEVVSEKENLVEMTNGEEGTLKGNLENTLPTKEIVSESTGDLANKEAYKMSGTEVKVDVKDDQEGTLRDLKESSKGEILKEAVSDMTETHQNGFGKKEQNSNQGKSLFDELEKTVTKVQEQKSVTTVQTVNFDNQIQTITKTEQTSFEGIVRQIVEQVKVQVKPDTVSMELQLNPENLGKVNLHVSSKEGAVTAQLFVQNETVKQAIEGQIMVLREAMQQQGIKVEAVEVTVQTGDFNRNLRQHEEDAREHAKEQARKVSRKNINLLDGLEETEGLEEEEILRAHIMRQSGNSLDMNA